MEVKQKIDGNSKFEFIYSLLMLVLGFGVVACFLVVIGFMIYVFNFMFIIFFLPLLIGIWVSIFRRSKDGYDTELHEKDGRKIMNLIENICKKTGQKKPHKIIVTDGSEVAVTGFFRKKVIIGMVALRFMNEEDLLAILAHEYGHFANKDTILGYFIYRIQYFIEIQKSISYEGVRDWSISIIYLFQLAVYIPTYIFFWLFSKYFLLISLWYGRCVEFRADNFASNLIGEQNFAEALVKYCIIADIFDSVVPEHVLHYLKQDKQIVNVYQYIKPLYSKENIKHGFNTVLSNKSSWWSTHPSISERLELMNIKKVDIKFDPNLKDVLENQEKYEKEASEIMTYKMDYWLRLVALAQQGYEVED